MKDTQIVDWIREGRQRKAFTKLYRHFPAIRKMIRENGGNKEDAEDIFQEALIVFTRKCEDPSFTLTASASTYLYSVSRFLWSEEKRKRLRIPTSDIELPNSDLADWQEVFKEEEKFRSAESVLKTIGAKCLELLKMFYIAGRSMKEIASRMELSSEKIAKNQKYKCLERARESYRKTQTPQS